MNVIARLDFELDYKDAVVLYIGHYTTGIASFQLDLMKKKKLQILKQLNEKCKYVQWTQFPSRLV